MKFWEFLSEFLNSNFNFDTKLGRTMLELLLSPGEITKQFNSGKRVRYVRPLQLYLFVSFLYFLLLGLTSDSMINNPGSATQNTEGETNEMIDLNVNGDDALRLTSLLKTTDPYNEAAIDSLLAESGFEKPEEWERHAAKQAVRALNPEYNQQLKQEVFANLSWAMFLLLPLFAFYLWLLVRKTNPFYIDSIIFSVHFHTVVFILFGVRVLSEFVYEGGAIEALTSFLVLLYLILSIKNVHGLRWRWAILKSALLTVSYSMTFGIMYICIVLFSFWFF